jgi:hypothetical protein
MSKYVEESRRLIVEEDHTFDVKCYQDLGELLA